jgi:transposase
MARCCSQRTESGGETRPFVITLSRDERAALEATTRKYISPYRDVIRAKIVLLASAGLGNDLIASRLNLARQIVSKWRNRLFDERLADLNEDPRGGRRARFAPIVVVEVKRLACEAPLARGVPLARWFLCELQRELLTRGVVATVFK